MAGNCLALNYREQVYHGDTWHEGGALAQEPPLRNLQHLQLSLTLFSDNQAAIVLMHNHQYHARTKHIDVCYHWIHWMVEEGAMCLIYCSTNDMVTNALTKALPSPKVKHFAACLRLCAK